MGEEIFCMVLSNTGSKHCYHNTDHYGLKVNIFAGIKQNKNKPKTKIIKLSTTATFSSQENYTQMRNSA